MSESVSGRFSSSYLEARRRFLEAANEINAAIATYKHPTQKGIDGEELSIDLATVGDPDSRSALVLMSGTHGIEGYCGSAIQIAFMRSSTIAAASHVKVILVHGLNPYGFSHCRRVNEDNVDLNRNFIDFTEPPDNDAYPKIANLLQREPSLFTRAALIAYVIRNGFRSLQDAVTRGQYSYPEGLFFGGRLPSWSRAIWSKILAQHLRDSQRAIFIDYHTGLGKYGAGEILCPADPHSHSGQKARHAALKIFGDQVRFLQTDESNSALTPEHQKAVATPPSGDILKFTIDSRNDGSFLGIFLEFGTLGPFAVLAALMAENAAWHELRNAAAVCRSQARLRKAFCPDNRAWKSAVLGRALEVTSRAALNLIDDTQ